MAKTIVGTFESAAEAERVASALEDSGIERRHIQVIDSATASGREQQWRGEPESSGGFWSWLFGDVESESGRGFADEESQYYTEGLTRGETLVVVTTADGNAERVRQLMERRGAQDVQAHAAGEARGAQPPSATREGATGAEEVLPVVDEQVRVGKRTVQRGGVRVYTHVTERPVEEHLRLREERIRVERRPVDRPLTGTPAGAFEEQSIEMTESAEEPVVQKQARVVEEVVVGKDVSEREETIRDTTRHTEVEVERAGAGAASGFAALEPEFRQHCTRTSSATGLTYEQCAPAYRYGYELAGDARHGGEWASVEGEARRQWEQRNPGTWSQSRDAIRYAWDRTRGGQARAA